MPLHRFLLYLLRGRWEDAGVDAPIYFLDDYPAMAWRIIRLAKRPRFGDPRVIALELGVEVLCWHVTDCYGEVYGQNTILYSCKGGPRAWGLRIYHGLAHWVLETLYHGEYSEADAWLLTVELAFPGSWLLNVGAEEATAQQPYAPEWLARLYNEEMGELAVRRARRVM